MLVGADILRQRERAGIEDKRASLAVVPDHRGEHGHRDLILCAHVARQLGQVPDHVDAGAHLGDPAQMVGMEHGRGRPDADDVAGDPGVANLAAALTAASRSIAAIFADFAGLSVP